MHGLIKYEPHTMIWIFITEDFLIKTLNMELMIENKLYIDHEREVTVYLIALHHLGLVKWLSSVSHFEAKRFKVVNIGTWKDDGDALNLKH